MTDLFGVPLSVGDKVAYTLGHQRCEYMEVGTILEIDGNRAYVESANGRRMTNSRGPSGLISVNPIKAQHPELFV